MKGNKGGLNIKIDLKKAYDKLDWSFIRHMLLFFFFQFSSSTINLIMNCISSSGITILVNGSTTEYFLPSKGIRQADPLSSYIFTLSMEYFSILNEKEVCEGSWKPNKAVPDLSHCLFVYDIVLFGKGDMDTINSVKRVLESYCDSSGQVIREAESRFYASLPFLLLHLILSLIFCLFSLPPP